MDKEEEEVQKALGTIKRSKYKVSFVYERDGLPNKSFFYRKCVFAYTTEEAMKKVAILFSKDPMLAKGKYMSQRPVRKSTGMHVMRWDNSVKRKGAWIDT